MALNEVVANYATKSPKGVQVDLDGLTENEEFRTLVVDATVEYIKQRPAACVVFQSYKSNQPMQTPLGKLINELALTLPQITLVTGNVKNIEKMYHPVKRVVLIKQSFRQGSCLKDQIAYLKEQGVAISVLCLMAHCKEALQSFGAENGVEVSALIYTEEI